MAENDTQPNVSLANANEGTSPTKGGMNVSHPHLNTLL